MSGTGPATTDVRVFGARGDGVADDTEPLRAAIAAMTPAGGTVVLPPGRYLTRALELPQGVSLQGTYSFATTATGSWLYCVDRDAPALTLHGGNAVREVAVFYPEQGWDDAAGAPAVAYPPTVFVAEHACRLLIRDVLIANAYDAIDADRHHEYLVLQNIQGYAIRRGVITDFSTDIDRWTTVHFNINCLWEAIDSSSHVSQELMRWTRRHGTAFTVRRADWLVMTDCFCWGYRTGLRLEESPAGHGSPGGIHAIACGYDACGLCVHMSSGFAVKITDCFFVGMNAVEPGKHTADAAVIVDGGADISIRNGRWWGCERGCVAVDGVHASMDGNGFHDYGGFGPTDGRDWAAVALGRGLHQVNGNQFSGLRVYLSEGAPAPNPGNLGVDVLDSAIAVTLVGNAFSDLDGVSIRAAAGVPVVTSANIHRGCRPGVASASDVVVGR